MPSSPPRSQHTTWPAKGESAPSSVTPIAPAVSPTAATARPAHLSPTSTPFSSTPRWPGPPRFEGQSQRHGRGPPGARRETSCASRTPCRDAPRREAGRLRLCHDSGLGAHHATDPEMSILQVVQNYAVTSPVSRLGPEVGEPLKGKSGARAQRLLPDGWANTQFAPPALRQELEEGRARPMSLSPARISLSYRE